VGAAPKGYKLAVKPTVSGIDNVLHVECVISGFYVVIGFKASCTKFMFVIKTDHFATLSRANPSVQLMRVVSCIITMSQEIS